MPGPSGGFDNQNAYKVLRPGFTVVPDKCNENDTSGCTVYDTKNCTGPGNACTVLGQLQDLSTLNSPSPQRPWTYGNPSQRVPNWISENTGDLVLLANLSKADGCHPAVQYFFDENPLQSTHGNAERRRCSDSDGFCVPGATAPPGVNPATDTTDTTLVGISGLLSNLQQPIQDPTEAKALAAFFGIPWWN